MNTAVLYVVGATSQNSCGRIIDVFEAYGINARQITTGEILDGKLHGFDAIVVPGGRATGIAEALGKEGCNEIESFVKNGGGYVGICAGAFLAARGYNDPTSKVMLVNAEALDIMHWDRGSGDVQVKVMDSDHPVMQGYSGAITVNYENGPLLIPAKDDDIPPYIDLAAYISDVHQNKDAARGIMPGSSAVTVSGYGKGRCVLFSFHPESTPGLERMLVHGFLWAAKRSLDHHLLGNGKINTFKVKGAWLWGSTVYNNGPDGAKIITGQMKRYGFTDIFLLVDGESGSVGYNSEIALSVAHPDRDILKNIVEEAHKKNLRVHAWFVINSDMQWAHNHPDDAMRYIDGRADESGKRVSLLSISYREYVKKLICEVIRNYDVDGIHVDYIRYMDAEICFNERNEVSRAKALGINMKRVKEFMDKTFYIEKDMKSIFEAYDNGDKDIRDWINLRKDAVNSFAREIRDIVKGMDPEIKYSASLVPWGAYDSNFLAAQENSNTFADVEYGQNYKDASSIYDFIIPMTYWNDFKKSPQWVSKLYENARSIFGKDRVLAGIQAYSTDKTGDLCDTIYSIDEIGADGVVLFRYGAFGLGSICMKNIDADKNILDIVMTNTLSPDYAADTDITKVEIYMMGGLAIKKLPDVINGCEVNISDDKKVIIITGSPCMVRNDSIRFSAFVEGENKTGRECAQIKFFLADRCREIRVLTK
ncbi:MAG: family 10 glycosylhydrolase [Clostridiales bacterium]|nr:family 10 glycosylhydrolase [Clostridiales bacterium]